ncbi:8-oxo-dGTP diphosphatase [Pseudarcicella hirudinis]|uniref:8-oxo-dGTP diphosphatase n=2 Tax=Pseudarcicella hirudinis TaxID=1079859 RepID=A0A1I5NRR2_9BACT|nr:8-oxo-dGTP diphosphatase [Pseudarcicella hirudinis]
MDTIFKIRYLCVSITLRFMTPQVFTYSYPHPAVTVDCIIFGFDGQTLRVLLIQRAIEPFAQSWALPGAFLLENESLEECASRVLQKECNISGVYLEQLFTFGEPARDPRERVLSIAYLGLIKTSDFELIAGNNELRVAWKDLSETTNLAFDHNQILQTALTRIRGKIKYQPIGFELLDSKFTIPQLQQLYEAILGKNLDRRNFRKKLLSTKLLRQLSEKQQNVAHKAAYFYEFDRDQYLQLMQDGIYLELV